MISIENNLLSRVESGHDSRDAGHVPRHTGHVAGRAIITLDLFYIHPRVGPADLARGSDTFKSYGASFVPGGR